MSKSVKRAHSPTAQPLPPITVLDIGWSDGVSHFQGAVNAPTEEQLKPNSEDGVYYAEVEHYSKKELHWLERLAGLTIEQKDPALKNLVGTRLYLNKLPENYKLFETKGHTKRSDTYLYGHPKGPRKRFRSPQEFLPHFLWLASDVTKNPANCRCDKCKGGPVGTRTGPEAAPASPTTVSATSNGQALTGSPVPSPIPAPAPAPALAPPQPRKTAVPTTRAAAPRQLPSQARVAAGPMPVPENILLGSRTHSEREKDLAPLDLNVYRMGEQVWFQTGAHWALGVVVDVPSANRGTQGYKIHPLHSPLISQISKSQDEKLPLELRPWSAWSTPPISDSNLDQHQVDFENLPWRAESQSATVEVSASIIKSREVDGSYTLIDRLTTQNHFAGVYYGAEKIWIGDALRIKPGITPAIKSSSEILIVTAIQDQSPTIANATRTKQTGVYITGNVYRLSAHKEQLAPPNILPQFILQDLADRNHFTISSNPSTPYWTYSTVSNNVTVPLESVKGRWYPGAALYRIINGNGSLVAGMRVPQESWDDTGAKLNEMGTGGMTSERGWRRFGERHQVFTQAIPANIRFEAPEVLQQSMGVQYNVAPNGPHMDDDPMVANMASAGLAPGGIGGQGGGRIGGVSGNTGGVVDLTGDEHEFLEDDDFMQKMQEDAASFLVDQGDGFYGGL